MNGVIETATGDLLRAGYCDFSSDGSFDPATETYRTDVPDDAVIRACHVFEFTNWNGSSWISKQSLTWAKAARKMELTEECADYLHSRYAVFIRQLFTNLYLDAEATGLTARSAALETWLAWIEDVAVELDTKHSAVDAAGSVAAILEIVLDTATLTAADPDLTLAGVLALTT